MEIKTGFGRSAHLLAITALLLSLPFVAAGQDPASGARQCSSAKRAAYRSMTNHGPRGLPAERDARAADTDVLHYKLELEFRLNEHWIGGSNVITVRSLIDGLTGFRFRLHQVLTISDVRVDDVPATWTRVDEASVDVTLNRAYAAGEEFHVLVAYAGNPPQSGYLSITPSHAYNVSEPWFAYLWWPVKDDLLDKTTAELAFTVPNGFVVASNGSLLGIDALDGSRQRYRWSTQYPTADYLYCFGIANYNTFDATWTYGGTTMPLKFYITPASDDPQNRASCLATADMLTVFSDLYGIYPFIQEKYGIYEFSDVAFGGMEHQTMTGQQYFGEEITSHELAHQWWGDNVTCATWHDIWLNEGFATYSSALYEEFRPGGSAQWLHWMMSYLRPTKFYGTVYCFDASDPERLFDYDYTYLKGGWVLHMLRHVIGDAAFFQTLAAYRAEFQGGAATTADFERIVEAVSGRELSWFFAEWVYGSGAPSYSYAWRSYVIDGLGYVEVYVNRLGNPFTMPIDIETTDSAGTHTHVIWNDARNEHLLFPVEGTNVTAVTFDPKPWILRTGLTQANFVESPPKIVTMKPTPGTVSQPTNLPALEIVFQKDVVADAAQFSLVGANHGVIPCAFSYDNVRHAVTLTPAALLLSDTYTSTVSDTIVAVAGGKKLDGELIKPDGPNPLPSGDGVQGGSAVAQFVVTVPGDLNCDGFVDAQDIRPFVIALNSRTAYEAANPGCPFINGDCNNDGRMTYADINPFVQLLGSR